MAEFLDNVGLYVVLNNITNRTHAEVQSGVNTTVSYANNTFWRISNVVNVFNGASNNTVPVCSAINDFVTNSIANIGGLTGNSGQLYSWNASNVATAINVATGLPSANVNDITPAGVGSVVNIILNMTMGTANTVPLYSSYGNFGGGLNIDTAANASNVNSLITSAAVYNALNNFSVAILNNTQINSVFSAVWQQTGNYVIP